MQHGRALQRRDADPAATDSTLFSVSSSANNKAAAPLSRAGSDSRSQNQNKKKSLRRRFKLRGFNNILQRGRRKRTLSEIQLRKKVKKSAEKEDWYRVRKLIANYEFSDIHEATMSKRGSFNPKVPVQEEPPRPAAARRPSYGSRNGEHRSFTGGESAAAAAVIKAAMLEESSGSYNEKESGSSADSSPVIGENILHDICRFHPPLDVLETLLTALRHQRGSTFGTDDQGRTPLHLAAASGAAPQIIDALVRADPTPASIGDIDGRSPLHLAMKYLVNKQLDPVLHIGREAGKNQIQEIILSPEESMEQTFQIVQTLKDAMLTYPGKIDFKDKDRTGYSPLDYAIDGSITQEGLIQTLIRRREPRCCRSSHRAHGIPSTQNFYHRGFAACGPSVYSAQSRSSGTGDLDIDILEQLEQDEIKACSRRIEKIKAKQQEECVNYALFDVFGIEAQLLSPDATEAAATPVVTKPVEDIEPLHKAAYDQQAAPVMEDHDIYNQHLQDYFDDMDDFEEHCDEDGFDIFEDPDLAEGSGNDHAPLCGNTNLPAEIVFFEEDDCVSMMSGVTVPVI